MYVQAIDTVTIPLSGTTSTVVTIASTRVLAGIITPAALTGTNLSFEISVDDGSTWVALYNGASAYSLAFTASKYMALNKDVMAGIKQLRIVSDGTELAARTFTLVMID